MFRKFKTCTVLPVLLATFTGSSAAWGRPPQPRTETGVIESVDPGTRSLRLRRENRCEPLTVVWNPRTRLLVGDRLGTAARLQAGARAKISYRTPFFGDRFATKIELMDSTSAGSRP